MRTANNRDTWVTNLATEDDTPLFKKPNGEKYQLKMSRTLSSTFFDDKLPATLQVNAFLCVNFFTSILSQGNISALVTVMQSKVFKKPSLRCITGAENLH
jgi:hypothetical protein